MSRLLIHVNAFDQSLKLPTEALAMFDQYEDALKAALEVQRNAYAPYSDFKVGAALVDCNGKIHVGCNVENASYGLTVCAERTAFGSAVSQGIKQFTGLVIVSTEGVAPCGACRQFAVEFCEELPIVLFDSKEMQIAAESNLSELMPMTFRL